jgi:hypothetical protein
VKHIAQDGYDAVTEGVVEPKIFQFTVFVQRKEDGVMSYEVDRVI